MLGDLVWKAIPLHKGIVAMLPPPYPRFENTHAFEVASIKVQLKGTWLLLGSGNVRNLFYCVESLELRAGSPHPTTVQAGKLLLDACSFLIKAGNENLQVSGNFLWDPAYGDRVW